jgi:hypothetical protein
MMVRLKVLPDKPKGGAWPPTARVVRCPLKCGNERDPHSQLQPVPLGAEHSVRTAIDEIEEGAGDGRSVCP